MPKRACVYVLVFRKCRVGWYKEISKQTKKGGLNILSTLNKFTLPSRGRKSFRAHFSSSSHLLICIVSGYDTQETIVKLLADSEDSGSAVGIDCSTGETITPADHGILDNYNVKRQMIHSATIIASNLLLVDEIMRAGMSSLKG